MSDDSDKGYVPPRGAEALAERYQKGERVFTEASMWRARLQGMRLDGADLSGGDFLYADLKGASLRGVRLSSAQLEGADLSEAVLTSAVLKGAHAPANFTRARLSRANLSGADLKHACLTHTDLTEADLTGTDLSEAILTDVRLYGATYDSATSWPAGFDPGLFGAIRIDEALQSGLSEMGEDQRSEGGFARERLVDPTTHMTPEARQALDHDEGLVYSLWQWEEGTLGTVMRPLGALALSYTGLEYRDGLGRAVRQIAWGKPFNVQLAVWPHSDDIMQLGVSLSARAGSGAERLRFKTTLAQSTLTDTIPIQQIHASFLPLVGFRVLWPWIVFHAHLHGQDLRGLVETSPSGAGKKV